MKTQYTIRGISPELDARLRREARLRRMSLNQLVIESLEHGTSSEAINSTEEGYVNHDFDWFIGSGPLESEVEEALKAQRVVNPKDWQ